MSEKVPESNPKVEQPGAKKKKSWLMRICKVFVIFIIFLLLLIILLPIYSPLFKSFISGPIEKMTGRKVSVGSFSVSIITSRLYLENLVIKEEDGNTDFLNLKKVDVDFSIWPLIARKVDVPKVEISGLTVKIKVDETGKSNIQSILDKQNEGEESKTQKYEKPIKEAEQDIQREQKEEVKKEEGKDKKAGELPKIIANLIISDINLSYENLEEKRRIDVKDLGFECNVNDLENITYKSKWDKAGFKVEKDKEQSAGILYNLDGRISLKMKEGKPVLYSNGKLSFSKGYVKGFCSKDVDDRYLELSHELSLDMSEGVFEIKDINLASNYFNFNVSEVEIKNLDKFEDIIKKAETIKDKKVLKNIISTLPIDGWKGKAKGYFDINKLKEELGGLIVSLSNGALEDFGGKIEFNADFRGEPSTIKGNEKFQVDNLCISGNITEKKDEKEVRKPYKIALSQILQTFEATADLKKAEALSSQKLLVTAPDEKQGTSEIVKMTRDIGCAILEGDKESFEVQKWEDYLMVDITALGRVIKDFLPSGMHVRGKLENSMKASSKENQINVNGVGGIDSFMFSMPGKPGEKAISISLEKTEWRGDLSLKHSIASTGNITLTLLGSSRGEENPCFEITTKGGKLLEAYLSGKIQKQGESVDISGLSLKVVLNGEPLQKLIPVDLVASGDEEKKRLLTKDLSMGGKIEAGVQVDGSQDKVNVKLDFDMTPFLLHLKNPKGEYLVNKGNEVPIFLKTDLTYTKIGEAERILVNPVHFRLADINVQTAFYLDEKQTLTGPDGKSAVVLEIPKTELDSLHSVFPILKKMEFNGATVELKVHDLRGNIDKKDMEGKLKFDMVVPSLSLVKLEEAMGQKKKATPTPGQESPVKEGEKTEEKKPAEQPVKKDDELKDKALSTLDSKTREMLKKFGVDIHVQAGNIELDPENQMKDLDIQVDFNKEKPDNKFLFKTTGKLNPDKANAGRIEIMCNGDMDQENPPFELNYDIIQMPYIIDVFSPITDKMKEYMQFPLLQKVKLGDPTKITFYLEGSNKWNGIDWRGIKKSILSSRTNTFKLPSGEFDLGFDVSNFLDIKALQGEIEKKIESLKNPMSALQGEKDGYFKQIKPITEAADKIQKRIDEIDGKRQILISTIKKLKPLAAFNPFTKRELNNAEEQLKSHDKEIEEFKKDREGKLGSIKGIKEKMEGVQKKMDELQAKINKAQEEFKGKMGIDNPFKFNFDQLNFTFSFLNDNPWAGLGGLSDIAKHPTSKVEYLKIEFTPTTEYIPKITGWFNLDGSYRFLFAPSEKRMAELNQKAPFLANILLEKGGVVWTSEGFEPNPFKK